MIDKRYWSEEAINWSDGSELGSWTFVIPFGKEIKCSNPDCEVSFFLSYIPNATIGGIEVLLPQESCQYCPFCGHKMEFDENKSD